MKRRSLWLLLDALFVCIGLLVSVEFYFSLRVSSVRMTQMFRTLPILLATTLLALWLSGIYKSLLKYAGADTFLQAVSIAKGGELFILDMGQPVKIKDLAEKMIRLYGTGREEIIYTGLRPGEKLYEELLLDKENDQATERDRIYVAKQDHYDWETVQTYLQRLEDTLEKHGDIKKTLQEILPAYHIS